MSAARPVVAELFERKGDAARLIGTRCLACGALYFPQTVSCRDPQCRGKRVERAALPDRGTVHSFTVQRYRPPPAFRINDWAPYALALVDLGEGLMVLGMLRDVPLDAVRVGMEVRTVVTTLFEDGNGTVESFAFAATAERAGAG